METKRLFDNRRLARLCGPLILEQLLAVMIGMADTVMVSGVGEHAVSAISLVDTINSLFIQVFSALTMGGTVVAAQFIGAQESEHANDTGKQLIWVSTLVGLVLGSVICAFNGPILSAIYGELEPVVMRDAQRYFWLSAASYPFMALAKSGVALFYAMGNSRVTLVISLMMNLLNMGGNALLIYGLDMGVIGAGLASLVSRMLGAVAIIWLLCRYDGAIRIRNLLRVQWDRKILQRILRIGVPSGMEGSAFQAGKLMVVSMISPLGTSVVAANAILNTVTGIALIPGLAMNLAVTTVVGQCVGARAFDEAKIDLKKLMLVSYAIMTAVNVFLYVFIEQVTGFFDLSEQAAALVIEVMKDYAVVSALFWTPAFLLPSALRATGDARFTMWGCMGSLIVLRVGLSYFCIHGPLQMGLFGLWLGMYADWIGRTVCFGIRYARGKWRQMALVQM